MVLFQKAMKLEIRYKLEMVGNLRGNVILQTRGMINVNDTDLKDNSILPFPIMHT